MRNIPYPKWSVNKLYRASCVCFLTFAFVFVRSFVHLFVRSFVSLSTCVSNSMPICPFNVLSHGELARFRLYFFSVRFTLRSKIGLTSLEYWGVDEVIYFIVANKRCILCKIAKSFITTRKR